MLDYFKLFTFVFFKLDKPWLEDTVYEEALLIRNIFQTTSIMAFMEKQARISVEFFMISMDSQTTNILKSLCILLHKIHNVSFKAVYL